MQISQKNNEITTLQNALQMRRNTQEHKSLFTDQLQKSEINLKYNMKQASLQQEIDQLNSQIKSLVLENRKAEKVLQEVGFNIV